MHPIFIGQDRSPDPERNRAPGLNPVQMIADDHVQDLLQNPAQSEFCNDFKNSSFSIDNEYFLLNRSRSRSRSVKDDDRSDRSKSRSRSRSRSKSRDSHNDKHNDDNDDAIDNNDTSNENGNGANNGADEDDHMESEN